MWAPGGGHTRQNQIGEAKSKHSGRTKFCLFSKHISGPLDTRTTESFDLQDHRWGYLVDAIGQVVPLMFALRMYWDKADMLRSGREEDGPGPANADKAQRVTNDDIESVDKFIRSSSHWCYLRMLQSTSIVVKVAEVRNWRWEHRCQGSSPTPSPSQSQPVPFHLSGNMFPNSKG